MNVEAMQMRKSIHDGIERNKSIVTFTVNGITVTESVRIAHESASVPANRTVPTGLGTSFSMYVSARYNSQIFENAVLRDGTNGWKVGAVDTLKVKSTIYGKRATLTKVTI